MGIWSTIFEAFQRLGKSLMLPIAVLPVAALFLRFGVLWDIGFVTAAGDAIFSNLPLLFGVGVAIGLSKDGHGSAALAGAVSTFIIIKGAQSINPDINMGVFSGIIGGIVAAYSYNRFKDIQLPDFLGFFAGKRFVPIMAGFICVIIAGVAGFVWPVFQQGLSASSEWIVKSGAFGLFIYGTLNRLLIPLGLHHVLNSYFWFQHGEYTDASGEVSNGDLTRFFAGDPGAGDFMAGFFPIMMFALPAAALAMYVMSKKEKRVVAGGILFSTAFTSFLTGITEPIEFAFMFLAFPLYILHSLLTGLSLALSHALEIKHGFGFSAGLIDYIVNFNLSTNGMMVLGLGVFFGAIYFFLFLVVIKTFNLKTIGREDDDSMTISGSADDNTSTKSLPVQEILVALGGINNLNTVDYCITRLRLTIKDMSKVNEQQLTKLGAKGFVKPSANALQIVFGQTAEKISDAINAMR